MKRVIEWAERPIDERAAHVMMWFTLGSVGASIIVALVILLVNL